MKKMAVFLLIASLVFAAAAILVARRHPRRATPPPAAPAQSAAPVIPTTVQPMDALQSGVKLDLRTDTRPDADAKRRLLERLQQEEKRQQPQERRN